mmetsp:Transcript_20149/g.63262  ORF Transcript_20149/g.63262 Transcript_20149/m.63262 type:complete len:353 (-) Transcript_20149:408-1466(-)
MPGVRQRQCRAGWPRSRRTKSSGCSRPWLCRRGWHPCSWASRRPRILLAPRWSSRWLRMRHWTSPRTARGQSCRSCSRAWSPWSRPLRRPQTCLPHRTRCCTASAKSAHLRGAPRRLSPGRRPCRRPSRQLRRGTCSPQVQLCRRGCRNSLRPSSGRARVHRRHPARACQQPPHAACSYRRSLHRRWPHALPPPGRGSKAWRRHRARRGAWPPPWSPPWAPRLHGGHGWQQQPPRRLPGLQFHWQGSARGAPPPRCLLCPWILHPRWSRPLRRPRRRWPPRRPMRPAPKSSCRSPHGRPGTPLPHRGRPFWRRAGRPSQEGPRSSSRGCASSRGPRARRLTRGLRQGPIAAA